MTPSYQMRAQQSGTQEYAQTVLRIQDALRGNDFAGARSQVEVALRQFPARGGLENLLGIADVQLGQTARARADFTAAIRHEPHLTSAYLNLARLQLNNDSDAAHAAALKLYDDVLRMDPANAEANFESASIQLRRGQYHDSLARLGRMPADAQRDVRVQSLLCADYAWLGDVVETNRAAAAMIASKIMTEADAAVPLPALRSARRADLIQSLYSSASMGAPLTVQGMRILGLAQEANGDLPTAQATLERVYSQDPSSAAALVDLARVAQARNDDTAALGYVAHARALSPTTASLPYEFGLICFRMKMLGEAQKAMGEAVALEPGNPQYNLAMGTVTALAQDPLQALPYLLKYNKLRPDDPKGPLTIGITYARARDADSARPWLQKAAQSRTTAAAAHYQLGSLLRLAGDYPAAVRELEESEHGEKDQPEVLAELGQTYLQMRNYDAARTQLSAALALDPDSYTANFALLQIYAHDNDPRRPEQAQRFNALRDRHEQQYRDAMRVIEVRPTGAPE